MRHACTIFQENIRTEDREAVGEQGATKFTNECNPPGTLWHGKQIIVDFVARIVSKMFPNTDDDNKRARALAELKMLTA